MLYSQYNRKQHFISQQNFSFLLFLLQDTVPQLNQQICNTALKHQHTSQPTNRLLSPLSPKASLFFLCNLAT